jgi:hypothetical protein
VTLQRQLEAAFDERLAQIGDRLGVHVQRLANLPVGPRWTAGRAVRFQQNTSPDELARRRLAFRDHAAQLLAFIRGQRDDVLLHGPELPRGVGSPTRMAQSASQGN